MDTLLITVYFCFVVIPFMLDVRLHFTFRLFLGGNFPFLFETFQTSTFQNLEMDKHYEVAVCPFPNFGKLESLENMLLLLQPLWVTVLSLGVGQGKQE